MSLAIDGSEDHLLKIRDLPNITIGDWQRAPKGTVENSAIIDDEDTIIEVDDNEEGLLYTAREVEEGITIKVKSKEDMTTDSGVDLDDQFDPDSESDFDDDIDSDEDIADENM